MRFLLPIFLLQLILPVPGARAGVDRRLPQTLEDPLPSDPMRVTVHRLANGLTVYLSPNALEPRVTAYVAVRAGSRHDPDDATGMAHYLEHMLFKGSRRLGTLDYGKERVSLDRIRALYEKLFGTKEPAARAAIYKEIDRENARAARYASPNEIDKAYKKLGFTGVNAFTSQEQTVFVCSFPKNRLEAWAAVESDRFPNAVFRLFQTEIETVYEEKNLYLDDPERNLSAALEEGLWGSHPLGHPIEGSVEHLKNPSLAKMYAFHDRYYVPDNMAIALSGDFDPKEALAAIRRRFGSWKPGAARVSQERLPPPLAGPTRKEIRFEAEEKAALAWRTVRHGDPDEDALAAMDMVFDNSQAGLVNLGLVQAQKVKSAGSSPDFHDEGGAWYLWAVPKKGQTLEQARDLLLETVARVKRGEFSEDDLRAIVTNFEIELKRSLESNDARAGIMAGSFAGHDEWPKTAARIERMRRVSRKDVIRVARKYLGAARVEVFRRRGKPEIHPLAKPEFTKVELDPARASAFFKEIVSLPAKPIEPRWLEEGRDYRVTRRPWGTLYSAKNPVNDLFELDIRFERGRKHERELCAALDLLNLSGAGTMPAAEFKKALYRLGTTLDAGCDQRDSNIHVTGLEANLPRSLELLRLHLLSPRIGTGALARMVSVQLGAHKDNKANPDAVFHALGEYAVFGPDSDVLREIADAELKALREDRLARLMRDVLAHARRTSYVGSRSAEEAAGLLDDGLPSYAPRPVRELRLGVRSPRDRVILLDRDVVQSKIRLSAADGLFDPDRAVGAQFYNEYMGGMSGVIFQQVREARALAYVAYGGYRMAERRGEENRAWTIVETQTDKTGEAATLIKSLMSGMPFEPKRFEEAKAALEQLYRTERIPFRAVPSRVMAWEDHDLPGDPRPARFRRVKAFSWKDLSEFARRFAPGPWTIFLIGKRDRIDLGALKRLGAYEEVAVDRVFPY